MLQLLVLLLDQFHKFVLWLQIILNEDDLLLVELRERKVLNIVLQLDQ